MSPYLPTTEQVLASFDSPRSWRIAFPGSSPEDGRHAGDSGQHRILGISSTKPKQTASSFSRRQHQIAAIQAYVGRFPSSGRETRALEWIEANAVQYRQAWHEQAAIEALARTRCPDCPLSEGDESPCEIHARWLALLRRYVAGELSSLQYVRWSLALLGAHKDHLKVTLARGYAQSANREVSG